MGDKEPTNTNLSSNENEGDKDDGQGNMRMPINYLMSSPAFMTATMRRQLLQEVVKSLPKNVQNRLNALRNTQLEALNLEAKFFEEVFALERKYQDLYQPLHDKRKKIITGEYEPSEPECQWKEPEDADESMEDKKDLPEALLESMKNKYPDDVKGIPDFWLTTFRNTELLSQMIQKHDEPAMKKLTDIKIVYGADKMSFTLEFYFDKNEFFTNEVLTKQYSLKSKVDPEYPFTFEGPEIYDCKGCTINWNKGMNLTIKTIHKKQKHKARGAVRTITKQVPNDSFFNFFNPPQVPEDQSNIDLDTQSLLGSDFEIGHFLRSRIIPKAVLYYTGDMVDDDEDEFDEEEEEEEEDDEDDEVDESESSDGGTGNKPTGGKKNKKQPAAARPGCKRQ